ncbi:MAG: general secretion pathway protein GspB [Endomicrobia bacterium]|nr:general secretion pathway protein GspB [Endomicrobiia bacterium]
MANYSVKQDLIFVILRNIILILVIVAIYHYLYVGYFKIKLDEALALEKKYQTIYADLETFNKINDGMYETKVKIDDIVSNYPAVYVPNQVLSAQFIDRVMSAAEAYSIKLTTETASKENDPNNTFLRLNFNAKYETTYKFLFSLEMFSKITAFSVNTNGDVSADVVPLTYSPNVDSYFSGRVETMDELRAAGYFKEIFKKSSDLLGSIDHVPSWRDVDPAADDPFYQYVMVKSTVKGNKPVQLRQPPAMEISGIISDAQNPIVIIDGKLFRVGDFYKYAKIVEILERTVTVEVDGRKYIIKFNKDDTPLK